MQRILALLFVLVASVAVGACRGGGENPPDRPPGGTDQPPQKPPMDSSAAIAMAQRLHDELNKLDVANNLEGQARYFADDVVRLDQFREPQRGKETFLRYARQMRDVGFKVESATTRVMHAWSDGTRLVEYGTTQLKGTFGGVAGEDPVNYLAVWRINPADSANAQIETIIWNTQKPIAGAEKIAQ